MSSFFCLVEVVFNTTCHNIFLMCQVVLKHLKKVHDFRLFIYKCKHVYTKGILHLSMLV